MSFSRRDDGGARGLYHAVAIATAGKHKTIAVAAVTLVAVVIAVQVYLVCLASVRKSHHITMMPFSNHDDWLLLSSESSSSRQTLSLDLTDSTVAQTRPISPGNTSSSSFSSLHMIQPSGLTHPVTTSKSTTVAVSSVRKLTGGYVLALDYWEQQMNALRNLIHLHCWAHKLGLSLVKPFTKDSRLRLSLRKSFREEMLPFEKSYDYQSWESLISDRFGIKSSMVDWDEFVSDAPRDVIVVNFRHNMPLTEHVNVSVAGADDYKSYRKCNKPPLRFTESDKEISQGLVENNFTVSRSVCFNFDSHFWLTERQFLQHIYGDKDPKNVTIVMTQWRGFGENRVYVDSPKCKEITPKKALSFKVSKTIYRDAEKYIQKHYLGQPFVAVLIRTEHILIKNSSVDGMVSHFEAVLEKLKEVRKLKHLNYTFLAADFGVYGSQGYILGMRPNITSQADSFVRGVFTDVNEDGTSMKGMLDWEASFRAVVDSSDRGYVALVQQQIAMRAKCIVTCGKGLFLERTIASYLAHHPKNERCVYTVTAKL